MHSTLDKTCSILFADQLGAKLFLQPFRFHVVKYEGQVLRVKPDQCAEAWHNDCVMGQLWKGLESKLRGDRFKIVQNGRQGWSLLTTRLQIAAPIAN